MGGVGRWVGGSVVAWLRGPRGSWLLRGPTGLVALGLQVGWLLGLVVAIC